MSLEVDQSSRLSTEQKNSLLSVYRTYVNPVAG